MLLDFNRCYLAFYSDMERERRINRCSNCGQVGHNARRCLGVYEVGGIVVADDNGPEDDGVENDDLLHDEHAGAEDLDVVPAPPVCSPIMLKYFCWLKLSYYRLLPRTHQHLVMDQFNHLQDHGLHLILHLLIMASEIMSFMMISRSSLLRLLALKCRLMCQTLPLGFSNFCSPLR